MTDRVVLWRAMACAGAWGVDVDVDAWGCAMPLQVSYCTGPVGLLIVRCWRYVATMHVRGSSVRLPCGVCNVVRRVSLCWGVLVDAGEVVRQAAVQASECSRDQRYHQHSPRNSARSQPASQCIRFVDMRYSRSPSCLTSPTLEPAGGGGRGAAGSGTTRPWAGTYTRCMQEIEPLAWSRFMALRA